MSAISVKEVGIGFTTHRIFNTTKAAINLFIFIALGKNIHSFIWMLCFTFVYTLMMIWIYDDTKKDLILVEIRKKNEDEKKTKKKVHVVRRIILSIQKAAVFLTILLWDPFVMVIYYRKGSYKWNYIPDNKILLLLFISTFVCNAAGFYILKAIF